MKFSRSLLVLVLLACTLGAFGQSPRSDIVTLQSAATATGNGTALDVGLYGGVAVQITGTFSATVTFEATIDRTNWIAVKADNLNDRTSATTATAAGIFQVPLSGAVQFRARVSAYSSGSVTVKARGVAGQISLKQSSGGGGGGTVDSVFGRTGTVAAATNDYTWAQIDKTTSSLADITTRSASDLNAGTVPLARLAGITTAELSAAAGITNAQLAGSIAYNKLSLANSIVNADVNSAAAIAYSKLSLTGQIVNADISASAAIAASKIAGLSTVATTGAYADLSGKPTLGTAAALNVPATGDAAAGEVVKGNDSRLSDARTPTTHTHAQADVTNLVSDLAGKVGTTRAINTGAGLSGGGNLTADRTLAVLLNSSGGLVSNLGAGTNELGIGANAVADSMLATVATATFKGRITAGTGNIETLTAAQATSLLSPFVGDSGSGGTKGLVPAPASGDATKFLQGNGTWGTPSGGGGSAITSLNGQTGTTQTFGKTDDTNVTLAINSATDNHQFTLGWTGTLAKARQNAATVYTDQANTFGAFVQTFQAGANHVLTDTTDTTKKFIFDASNIGTGLTRTVNIPNANSTTVQSDTGATNNFLTAISAQGVISKAQPSFSNLSGTATAGQLPSTAVNSVVNDTNVTGSISAQALTLAWSGTLAKSRQNAATVYTDQANTFGAFVQTFQAGSNFLLVDPTDTTKKVSFDASNVGTGLTRTVNIPNANSTTVQADTGAANNFLTAISAQGVISKAQPSFSNLSGTATAGQLPSTAVNSVVNDTNVTGSISAQALTLAWSGTLAKARQNAATVYNDAGNTFSTGAQDFGSATSLKVPSSASAAPTAGGLVAYDSTGFAMKAGINGVSKTFLMTDGSGANLTSLNGSSISSGTVAAARGGTGFDSSASSGVPYVSSGTWSATASAGTSAQWLANSSGALISRRREHVPQAYGAACNGSTNDQSAIQTMMNALVSGDRVSFAGCLNFALSSSVTIGNGSGTYNSSTSATASTVNDIEIDGAGATVTWTGSSGGPFIINGPISRLNFHGFSISMGGNAGIGVDINHARQSEFDNVYVVSNADWAMRIRAYQQWTPSDGANANSFSNIRVSSTTTGAKGLDIGDNNTCNACTMHLDVAHNNFRNIRVTFNLTASTYVTSSIGMRLQFTDAGECDGCILSAETALQVLVPSGTAGPSYPAGYLFNATSLQGTTASFAVSGTWTPVEKIGFTGYLTGDSQVIPTDANTFGITSKGVTWGYSSQVGEISGLRLEYVTTNQVKIYTGYAQVQSLGRTVTLTSDTTVTISSPSASTWYYCYLYESSGTGAIECNTTAPASTPWFGTASSKTSDTSRRYIGAVKTNASSNLYRFAHNPISGYYQWLEDTTASPFRVLSGGTDVTEGADTVDASAVVPAASRSVQLRMINAATTAGNIWLRTGSSNTNANLFTVRLNSDFISPMVVDSSRQFFYIYSTTPSGGGASAFFDVIGFFDLR